MDCSEFIERYSEYDDSLLPSGEAAVFRLHLAECPSCARYDRVLRKGRMLARQLPEPAPSEDFVPRLQWAIAGPSGIRNWGALVATLGALTCTAVAASAVHVATAGALDGPAVAAPDSEAAAGPGWARPGRRVVSLPPFEDSETTWTWVEGAGRVDHPAPATYSPLVTGPPAYRLRGSTSPTSSLRRTLD